MSTLHVLSHSPFTDTRLASCLRIMGSADAILLCGDASYTLMEPGATRSALESAASRFKLFILEEDAQARDIALPGWVQSVDYPGFVELSIKYGKVNSWL